MFHSNSQSNLNNKSNSPLNERNKETKYRKKIILELLIKKKQKIYHILKI